MIVNKVDTIDGDGKDVKVVKEFVRDNASKLLGASPVMFTTSSRLALKAKREAALGEFPRFFF